MPSISEVFHTAAHESRMAFMPFVTAGDPDLNTTAAVLCSLRDARVDLIELGFPTAIRSPMALSFRRRTREPSTVASRWTGSLR